MRSLVLVIGALVLSAEAPPPADLQQFEQALASYQYNEARSVVEKLIQDRVPTDGKPRRDPVLNAMIGRLYLAAHHAGEAASYLDYAPLADLPQALRPPTALDRARALELRGDRAAALASYRDAAAASENEDQRRRAAIGIARDLLAEKPAEVPGLLLAIANGSSQSHRWEARYLLALSSSLLGDGASARRWADLAWTDAATAPLPDLAPVRVATLRAGLAAAAHDVAAERAMLAASNGLGLTANSSLSEQLPVCGDSGLRPTDFVIFGFIAGPFSTRELVPIAASRPEAVLPFQDILEGRTPIKQGTGEAPLGTVFTLRCRSVVNSNFIGKLPSDDPIIDWSVEQGLYPASLSTDTDDEHLRRIDDWIDSLAARFGKASPLLIMPRAQLMGLLQERAVAGDPVLPGQLADLRTQIAEGLRRAGAPEWLAASVELGTEFQQMIQAAANGSDQTSAAQALFRKQLLMSPFEFARPSLLQALSNINGEWPSAALQLVVDLDGKAPASLDPRERRAWRLTVADALRSIGKNAQAQATIAAAGLPKDLCTSADSAPDLLDQHFSYSDYPQELIAGEQEGTVLFEFSLSPSGMVAESRAIYSLPSGLFDQPSAKGLATVRYTPPLRGGKPFSCRGLYQPIVWRLEDDTEFQLPVMTQTPGPTT
jgi:hypothetical protein